VQLWVREFTEAEHLDLGVGPQRYTNAEGGHQTTFASRARRPPTPRKASSTGLTTSPDWTFATRVRAAGSRRAPGCFSG
jgi:hypothetical protein